jgi:hypothetical protein
MTMASKIMPRLRVECPDGNPMSGSTRILFGDVDISQYVSAVTIVLRAGEPGMATIELLLPSVDIGIEPAGEQIEPFQRLTAIVGGEKACTSRR